MMCQYCGEDFFDGIYSIPLNAAKTRWDGEYCSPQCRLSANRYVPCFPHRSPETWAVREQWIRELDGPVAKDYAPPPVKVSRWVGDKGMTRDQWLGESGDRKRTK